MDEVGNRYRLDQKLGAGGAAEVFLAHDLVLERTVALKLLREPDIHAEGRQQRMRTEARSLAALEHPNVVRIYDVGRHGERDYLVMEYLELGSLADRIAQYGPMTPSEAVDAVLQVLSGLAAAHDAGIVHRDVKPANILVRQDTVVALCDFGIARTALGGADTHTGVALGSLSYMAPEQRVDARRVGPAADLYATACTLFNLVTADTPVDLYMAPDTSPRWDSVPSPLRTVIRRATRSEPSLRFENAADMSEALLALRTAIAGLPSAGSRAVTPLIGHVATRDVEPSMEAETRQRDLRPDDWAWAHPRKTPVGRTAVWVGVWVTAVTVVVGVAVGPLRDRLPDARSAATSAPEPPAAPGPVGAVGIAGLWRGTVGGHPASATLRRTGEGAITGEIEVKLGSHGYRARLNGLVDADRKLMLTEVGPEGTEAIYQANVRPDGLILEGTVTREDGVAVPFAWVRVE